VGVNAVHSKVLNHFLEGGEATFYNIYALHFASAHKSQNERKRSEPTACIQNYLIRWIESG
jgi:hypothetical protein